MSISKRIRKFLRPHWEYRDTITLIFFFCIGIAFFSWSFGRAELGKSNDHLVEQQKIIFPIIATVLIFAAPLLTSFYIKAQVEQDVAKERRKFINIFRKLREKYSTREQRLKEDYQRNIEALHNEFRLMTSEGIYLQHEIEYVSAIAQAFIEESEGFSMDQINIGALSQPNERKIISSSITIEELLRIDKTAAGRHLALTALLSSRGEEVLVQIARKALKVALPQSENDLDNITYKNFFLDILAYLKAWLVCSLANCYYMRIGVIKQRYPTKDEPDKEYYINALRHIKDVVFSGKQINNLLFYEDSDVEIIEAAKECIRNHLKYLIEQIESPTVRQR